MKKKAGPKRTGQTLVKARVQLQDFAKQGGEKKNLPGEKKTTDKRTKRKKKNC